MYECEDEGEYGHHSVHQLSQLGHRVEVRACGLMPPAAQGLGRRSYNAIIVIIYIRVVDFDHVTSL